MIPFKSTINKNNWYIQDGVNHLMRSTYLCPSNVKPLAGRRLKDGVTRYQRQCEQHNNQETAHRKSI